MSVLVLNWAAISVLGTEYGHWPTVIMHTGGACTHVFQSGQRHSKNVFLKCV